MKQVVLKRLLVGGIAALGIVGFSSPAVFAMSSYSNNNGSSYGNNVSRCDMMREDWNNNNNCRPVYRVNNNQRPCNRYGGNNDNRSW